jgi:hypothetical protein
MAVVPHLKNGNVLMKNGNVRGCCCDGGSGGACEQCETSSLFIYIRLDLFASESSFNTYCHTETISLDTTFGISPFNSVETCWVKNTIIVPLEEDYFYTFDLIWQDDLAAWVVEPEFSSSGSGNISNLRCDPSGYYEDTNGENLVAAITISTSPIDGCY